MIVAEGKYYLYRHIRLDKNEPFYIGVGIRKNNITKLCKTEYYRAFDKNGRNELWHRIVGKTNYEIDIIIESDDREFIFKKESEFIKLYGRIDLETGTLANFTDGGEGMTNVSKKIVEKSNATKRKTGSFYRNKEHLKKYRLPKGITAEWNCKPCYLYDSINGILISRFNSVKECAKFINFYDSTVNMMCRNESKYKKWIFTYNDYGGKINPNDFKFRSHYERRVVQYSFDGKTELNIYETAKAASIAMKVNVSGVSKAIKTGRRCGGFRWGWKDDALNTQESASIYKWKHKKPVAQIHPITKETIAIFDSLSQAGLFNNVTKEAIARAVKLNSKSNGYYWQLIID